MEIKDSTKTIRNQVGRFIRKKILKAESFLSKILLDPRYLFPLENQVKAPCLIFYKLF